MKKVSNNTKNDNENVTKEDLKDIKKEIDFIERRLDGIQEFVDYDIFLLQLKLIRKINDRILLVSSYLSCALLILTAFMIKFEADMGIIMAGLGFTMVTLVILCFSLIGLIIMTVKDVLRYFNDHKKHNSTPKNK